MTTVDPLSLWPTPTSFVVSVTCRDRLARTTGLRPCHTMDPDLERLICELRDLSDRHVLSSVAAISGMIEVGRIGISLNLFPKYSFKSLQHPSNYQQINSQRSSLNCKGVNCCNIPYIYMCLCVCVRACTWVPLCLRHTWGFLFLQEPVAVSIRSLKIPKTHDQNFRIISRSGIW